MASVIPVPEDTNMEFYSSPDSNSSQGVAPVVPVPVVVTPVVPVPVVTEMVPMAAVTEMVPMAPVPTLNLNGTNIFC